MIQHPSPSSLWAPSPWPASAVQVLGWELGVRSESSLRRVLASSLGDPNPGYPYPQEWLDQMRSWSRHNIAFGLQPGVLWIATPAGVLVEVDVETHHAAEHAVLTGYRLSAIAAGGFVVAGREGELVLLSVLSDSTQPRTTSRDVSRAAAVVFLEATAEVPDDGADLEALRGVPGERRRLRSRARRYQPTPHQVS